MIFKNLVIHKKGPENQSLAEIQCCKVPDQYYPVGLETTCNATMWRFLFLYSDDNLRNICRKQWHLYTENYSFKREANKTSSS